MAQYAPFGAGEDDDGFQPRSRRKSREAELEITPLIDVTFLLLIFFMVTANLQAGRDVDVPEVRHSEGVETHQATFITLLNPESEDADATILLGDGESSDSAVAELDDVRTYVEQGLSNLRTQVVVKAERKVPHRDVQRVAREIAAVDGITLHIGVQDAKR